jgi:hypothetical protein
MVSCVAYAGYQKFVSHVGISLAKNSLYVYFCLQYKIFCILMLD